MLKLMIRTSLLLVLLLLFVNRLRSVPRVDPGDVLVRAPVGTLVLLPRHHQLITTCRQLVIARELSIKQASHRHIYQTLLSNTFFISPKKCCRFLLSPSWLSRRMRSLVTSAARQHSGRDTRRGLQVVPTQKDLTPCS